MWSNSLIVGLISLIGGLTSLIGGLISLIGGLIRLISGLIFTNTNTATHTNPIEDRDGGEGSDGGGAGGAVLSTFYVLNISRKTKLSARHYNCRYRTAEKNLMF